MVRESGNEDQAKVAGRPEKRAVQSETESDFEALPPEKKRRALTRMQERIELGMPDEDALRDAIDDVVRGDVKRPRR